MMFCVRALGSLMLLGLAGMNHGDARAQQIYRVVTPDGRVTFSDKPPLEANARATAAPVAPLSEGTSGSALPYELRQASSRYPVTLYTGPGCAPCDTGRAMLSSRGIPFTERTVSNNDDIEALKRLAGAASLPFLTIGTQPLRGYAEIEWSRFLDAAGYPKTSQLPGGYSPPPAKPLVLSQEPQPPARGGVAAERPRAPSPVPAPAPAENPSGIRF
jgi:glutaredoxin